MHTVGTNHTEESINDWPGRQRLRLFTSGKPHLHTTLICILDRPDSYSLAAFSPTIYFCLPILILKLLEHFGFTDSPIWFIFSFIYYHFFFSFFFWVAINLNKSEWVTRPRRWLAAGQRAKFKMKCNTFSNKWIIIPVIQRMEMDIVQ